MRVTHEPFITFKNVPYERSLFRTASLQVNETVEQLITRLRERALYCLYGTAQNEMIRDQVFENCLSHRLRIKLLEMQDFSLDLLRRKAQAIEFSEKQALMMEGKEFRHYHQNP